MQEISLQEFEQAKQWIEQAQRICIISHRNPDADAVGANLSLREALENLGKRVSSACIDPIPQDSNFLRKAERYHLDLDFSEYDLIITVDCGSHKLVGFHEKHPSLLDPTKTKLINFDHHPSNDFFGGVNIVLPQTPATCFILFHFFNYCGWGITQSMATALMHGLYYDTGSMMHSNTSSDVLRMAARLKALGADHRSIVKKQFHTTSLEKLKLWGRALERVELNSKGAAVTAVTEKDYQETSSSFEDLSGLVALLAHVKEAKFCMLLTDDMRGQIKGSLRTQRDDINLSEMASLFGGGGHTKAAGFTIPGKLKEKRVWSVN